MEQSLFVRLLGVYVLAEHYCEERGLEEDVDVTRAHLDNCQVEHEHFTEEGYLQVVVHVANAVVLKILGVLFYLLQDRLFEGLDGFLGVLEQVSQVRVVSATPLWHPAHFE